MAELRAELQAIVSRVSHDFGGPVRQLRTFASMLLDECGRELPDCAREYIYWIDMASVRLTELLDGINRFSGSARLDASCDVDLAHVVTSYLDELEPDERARVDFEDRTRSHAVIRGSEPDLKTLVMELTRNALQFSMPEDGPIRIVIESTPAEFVLSVSDQGIGIPEREYKRVTEIFERLHGRDEFPGCGIGLAVCKRVARQHGARLVIDSSMGRGTEVSIRFPAR